MINSKLRSQVRLEFNSWVKSCLINQPVTRHIGLPILKNLTFFQPIHIIKDIAVLLIYMHRTSRVWSTFKISMRIRMTKQILPLEVDTKLDQRPTRLTFACFAWRICSWISAESYPKILRKSNSNLYTYFFPFTLLIILSSAS